MKQKVNPQNDQDLKFKVMIRVRPKLPKEEAPFFRDIVHISGDSTRVDLDELLVPPDMQPALTQTGGMQSSQKLTTEMSNLYNRHSYTFDHVFGPSASQEEVYSRSGVQPVHYLLQGYNSTILAYGHTGTGKTYTMEGTIERSFSRTTPPPESKGLIARVVESLFRELESAEGSSSQQQIRISYLQIYKENLTDLLSKNKNNLLIREDKKKGIWVEGLSEWSVTTQEEVMDLLKRGSQIRATACTKINDVSSRSHAVFVITLEQIQTKVTGSRVTQSVMVSKLNLVDLAGSERIKVSGAVGSRLEECKKINQSLSALSKVISSLVELSSHANGGNLQAKGSVTFESGVFKTVHIPYRDSKLTRLLEDSLGGNCITTLIGMIAPGYEAFAENLSTLKFANRAKNIKNKPVVNEEADKSLLISKYQEELAVLKAELQQVNKDIMTSACYFKLKQEKDQAEKDRQRAVMELETKTQDFVREREEKKNLITRISFLERNLMGRGENSLLASGAEDLHKHSMVSGAEIGSIREILFDKVEMLKTNPTEEAYKEVLFQQNKLLETLTARLGDRDETVMQLQEELETYDRIHFETLELLKLKNERIKILEEFLEKNNFKIPDSLRDFDNFVGKKCSTFGGLNDLAQNIRKNDVPETLARRVAEEEPHQGPLASKEPRNNSTSIIQDDLGTGKPKGGPEVSDGASENIPQNQIGVLQKKMDGIIKDLSSENGMGKLHEVAHDLLEMQTLIQNLNSASLERPASHLDSHKSTNRVLGESGTLLLSLPKPNPAPRGYLANFDPSGEPPVDRPKTIQMTPEVSGITFRMNKMESTRPKTTEKTAASTQERKKEAPICKAAKVTSFYQNADKARNDLILSILNPKR